MAIIRNNLNSRILIPLKGGKNIDLLEKSTAKVTDDDLLSSHLQGLIQRGIVIMEKEVKEEVKKETAEDLKKEKEAKKEAAEDLKKEKEAKKEAAEDLTKEKEVKKEAAEDLTKEKEVKKEADEVLTKE